MPSSPHHPRYAARALATVALASVAAAQTIAAPHQLVVVEAGADALISLAGYGKPGLSANVAGVPASGSLSQISKVFSSYGYEPVIGDALDMASTAVTGTANRVVYSAPSAPLASDGTWDTFEYTVSDGTSTSTKGLVTFVGPTGSLVSSSFETSDEGWTTSGNRVSSVVHDMGSRGTSVAQYVYATDDTVHLDAAGAEKSAWYFEAPSKFFGHRGIAYRGTLKFTMSALAGDFQNDSVKDTAHFVEISCAQCATNSGITLALPISAAEAFDGSATNFAIPLHEGAGWIKDPKSTLKTWEAPTQCEMIEVLSGLSGLRIRGDLTTWYESVALDAVSMSQTVAAVPVCAIRGATDGSQCTCSSSSSEAAKHSTFFRPNNPDVFSTIAQAVVRARALGLRGYHALVLFDVTYYLPGPTQAAYDAAVSASTDDASDVSSAYTTKLRAVAGPAHPAVATARYSPAPVTGNSAAIKGSTLYAH